MDLQKDLPIRNKKYLEWVKTLDCVYSGMPADDAHHIIGVGEGGMGTTASDLFVYPVTRGEHSKVHQIPERWPDQWEYVARTLREAVKQGVLVFDNEAMK